MWPKTFMTQNGPESLCILTGQDHIMHESPVCKECSEKGQGCSTAYTPLVTLTPLLPIESQRAKRMFQ